MEQAITGGLVGMAAQEWIGYPDHHGDGARGGIGPDCA